MKTLHTRKVLKKIKFVPLRGGLREIREIVLTPLNENNEEIKN